MTHRRIIGDYIDLCRGLSIIVIDPTGEDSILRLRDIGFDGLLRVIRSVTASRSTECSDEASKQRVLKSSGSRMFRLVDYQLDRDVE